MREEIQHELIHEIYDAASEPEKLSDVLDKIRDLFSARGCIIFEWHSNGYGADLVAPYFTSNYHADLLRDYLQKFRAWEEKDQFIYEHQSLATDKVELVSEEILYENEAEYLDRPNVKQMLEYGIRHRAGALLDKDNPNRSRFSIQMGGKRGPISADERSQLRNLLPHLAKSFSIQNQLVSSGTKYSRLLAAIDQLKCGVCLLDSKGRVELSNSEFKRQQDEYGAFSIGNDEELHFSSLAARKQLIDLLAETRNHGRFGARPRKEAIILSPEPTMPGLCFEVIPLNQVEELGSKPLNGALVVSRDTSSPIDINIELASSIYNFTQAESGVVALIVEGFTNAEIADRRNVSVQTVNSQVKAILSKSRTQNRTQLVRVLSGFSR